MPEARIRVAALHLAGARTLPLLCLGIGSGLQSRLVHHARSALKQQKLSTDPRPHRRMPPYVYARHGDSFCVQSSQKNLLIPSSPLTKLAAPTPKNNASVTALGNNLRLWTDTS